jgi:hypothetical protein
MKTLSQIIDLVKSGERPDYDELRYAVVALNALSNFDGMALMRLREAEEKAQRPFLTRSAVFQHNEHWTRWRAALAKSPKEYVGWNHDPDNPAAVRFYKQANTLIDRMGNKGKAG